MLVQEINPLFSYTVRGAQTALLLALITGFIGTMNWWSVVTSCITSAYFAKLRNALTIQANDAGDRF
jgi:hypothetical protein